MSSGAKAILDLPRTLEALETLGVPVVGVGTDELPAFYTRASGLPLEHRVDTPAGTPRLPRAHWALGHGGGVLLAHPIPAAHALDRGLVEAALERALAEADRAGVRGKALTPFLLSRLAETTEGRSLSANRALAVACAKA